MDKQDPHISVPPMTAQREEPSMQSLPPRTEQSQQRQPAYAERSSDGVMAPILMIVLIALVSAGGAYWIMNLQKQVMSLQASNLSQQENIDLLRQSLSSTGESATTSLDALSVKNDEQDFEIRKLWDVSNKRNKKQIAANRESAKSLLSKFSTLQQISAKHDKELVRIQANQGSIQDKVKAVESAQSTISEEAKQLLVEQNRSIAAMELSASQNREDLQQLNTQLKDLQQQLQNLRRQDDSDAMLSMQLTLDDIQARLNAMEAR